MLQYGTVVDSKCIYCYVRVRECPIFTFHLMGLYSYVYVETGYPLYSLSSIKRQASCAEHYSDNFGKRRTQTINICIDFFLFLCFSPTHPFKAIVSQGAEPTPSPLLLSPWRKVEIIWTSKSPPSFLLGQASDIAKPYRFRVKQRSWADVNSSYKQKCWANSRAL